MNIGIIGLGVVGAACKKGFELQGHTVLVHDTKLNTLIESILPTEIVYICVPTPSLDDGTCDISILNDIISQLDRNKYTGIIAIKSTMIPGTTKKLSTTTNIDICFVPEFLREWCAEDDFIVNHKLLAVGCDSDDAFNTVVKSHGTLPKQTIRLSTVEAEILKYYNNVFNALRITFANNMFELCKALDADYMKIKDSYLTRETATNDYMDCNDDLRGFGGMCLPKDTLALAKLFDDLNLNYDLIKAIHSDNKKFKQTIRTGMRKL
jgi:UDPglucose 6-dehydrogenase